MAVLQAKALTELIIKLGPIVLEATQTLRKWINKGAAGKEDLDSRVRRLEQNLELQAQLNERFIAEMKMLQPASESILRSFRLLVVLMLVIAVMSFAALVLVLLK